MTRWRCEGRPFHSTPCREHQGWHPDHGTQLYCRGRWFLATYLQKWCLVLLAGRYLVGELRSRKTSRQFNITEAETWGVQSAFLTLALIEMSEQRWSSDEVYSVTEEFLTRESYWPLHLSVSEPGGRFRNRLQQEVLRCRRWKQAWERTVVVLRVHLIEWLLLIVSGKASPFVALFLGNPFFWLVGSDKGRFLLFQLRQRENTASENGLSKSAKEKVFHAQHRRLGVFTLTTAPLVTRQIKLGDVFCWFHGVSRSEAVRQRKEGNLIKGSLVK